MKISLTSILKEPYGKMISHLFHRNFLPTSYGASGSIKEIIELVDVRAIRKIPSIPENQKVHHKEFQIKFDERQRITYGRKRIGSVDWVSTFKNYYSYNEQHQEYIFTGNKESIIFVNLKNQQQEKDTKYLTTKYFINEDYTTSIIWNSPDHKHIKQYHVWIKEQEHLLIYKDLLSDSCCHIHFLPNFDKIKRIEWIDLSNHFTFKKKEFEYYEDNKVRATIYQLSGKKMAFDSYQEYDEYYNLLLQSTAPVGAFAPKPSRESHSLYHYEYDTFGNWIKYYLKDFDTEELYLLRNRIIQYYN